jgi:peroxiredoxin
MRRSIGGEFGRYCLSHIVLDTPAPDFELADFHGKAFSLSDLHGSKNVLLVFNRGFT